MRIPDGTAEYEIIVRKSRFLARAGAIESVENAREEVRRLKHLQPEATHVVHACLCGPAADLFSVSDDREPVGTAGRPVLEILKGSGITDILVTITRWFGGTKLGTGGLVKAYAEAARGVLSCLPVRELEERRAFTLCLPYRFYEQAVRLTEEHGGSVTGTDFTDHVVLRGVLGEKAAGRWTSALDDLTSGKAELTWEA